MRHQMDVQSIETKLNTTWFDFSVFVLRVSMLSLLFKFTVYMCLKKVTMLQSANTVREGTKYPWLCFSCCMYITGDRWQSNCGWCNRQDQRATWARCNTVCQGLTSFLMLNIIPHLIKSLFQCDVTWLLNRYQSPEQTVYWPRNSVLTVLVY